MTELEYLADMQKTESTATVVEVRRNDGRVDVVLDRTIFYPQGGGQPADHGEISSAGSIFSVNDVRFSDGFVHHFGSFAARDFDAGDRVTTQLDVARRALHSRVHSAGHVVDMAVVALGLAWRPGKGYHFPDGPYVEYLGGAAVQDREGLKARLEGEMNRFVEQRRDTSIRFMPKEEMAAVCHFVPDELPAGKPQRVVLYGDFGVPCGGTHVANLGDLGPLTVRKLKFSGDTVRVSYGVV